MTTSAKQKDRTVSITVNGTKRRFDIDNPKLPDWIDDNDLIAGGYPYHEKLDSDVYEKELERLQVELVEMLTHLQNTGGRLVVVFEGRDAAGKGGSIKVLTEYLNPRSVRVVALPKPSDREQGQWYFQRYANHLPSAGEIAVFDRSWYNRGGVEPVMGFCTPAQHEAFLREAPAFERMITGEGIILIKFWLSIGQETQLKRFHDRRHSTLTHWKLSEIDIVGMSKWDAYTKARDEMLAATHTSHAPWTIVRYNDKKRGRLEALRHILRTVDYKGRSLKVIGEPNTALIGSGPKLPGHP